MTRLKDRMIRAAKLDVDLYEEVEADQGALGQAMVVVVLSSVAAGIGRFGQGGLGGVLNRNDRSNCRMVYLGLPNLFYWYKTTSRTTNQSRSW